MQTVKLNIPSGGAHLGGFHVVTPTHSSYHYKDIRGNTGFETPFLHELVGGDRNMEQNNLIVTPDGKTWDEVTRDTSYQGNMSLHCTGDNPTTVDGDINIFDEFRGTQASGNRNNMNKDFAIAYDRFICLKDGWYAITNTSLGYNTDTQDCAKIKRNGNYASPQRFDNQSYDKPNNTITLFLKRGDYIQSSGYRINSIDWNNFHIERA
jgi:hypothetical protein